MVQVVYYPKDKRRRDLDNLMKPLLDALEGQVFLNDNQVDVLSVSRQRPNRALDAARVEVFVEGLDTRD